MAANVLPRAETMCRGKPAAAILCSGWLPEVISIRIEGRSVVKISRPERRELICSISMSYLLAGQ